MMWHHQVNQYIGDHDMRTSLPIAEKDLQLMYRNSKLRCIVSRVWGFVSTLQLLHTRNATLGSYKSIAVVKPEV